MANAADPVDRGWAWVVVTAGLILYMLSVGGLKTFGIIVVELKLVLDIPVQSYLWVVSLVFTIHVLVGPAVSYFIHKFGRRIVALFGVTLLTSSMIGLSYSKSLAALILTFSIPAGVGCGCVLLTVLLIPSSGYFDKKKGLAAGIITSGSGLGGVVISQVLRALFDNLPYSFATLLYGGILLQGLIAATLLRPFRSLKKDPSIQKTSADENELELIALNVAESKQNQDDAEKPPPVISSSQFDWKLIINPRLLMICVSMFLFCMGLDMALTCIPILGESNGIDKKVIAIIITVSSVCEIVYRVLNGWFIDKKIIPVTYQYTICLVVAGIGSLLCGIVSGLAGIILSVTGLVMGTSIFGILPLVLEELLGKQRITTAMGYQSFFHGIAMIATTPITGYLRDKTGSWNIVFIYLGSCMLLSGLMLVPYCVYSYCSSKRRPLTE